jgi:hypothetical protein
MSHIFEALQRAEAEQSGSVLHLPASVAELLERAIAKDGQRLEPGANGRSFDDDGYVSEFSSATTISPAPAAAWPPKNSAF